MIRRPAIWQRRATSWTITRPIFTRRKIMGRAGTRINDGIREDDFTRVIRCDPARPGLLYAGTETGVYISFDDGASWQRFQLNLPVAPIHDLLVKNGDLIAATHGRSFWILDDLTRLHQLSATWRARARCCSSHATRSAFWRALTRGAWSTSRARLTRARLAHGRLYAYGVAGECRSSANSWIRERTCRAAS